MAGVAPPFGDIDVEEAVEAGNATVTAGETNQTSDSFHPLTFLFVQSVQSGFIQPISANDTKNSPGILELSCLFPNQISVEPFSK